MESPVKEWTVKSRYRLVATKPHSTEKIELQSESDGEKEYTAQTLSCR